MGLETRRSLATNFSGFGFRTRAPAWRRAGAGLAVGGAGHEAGRGGSKAVREPRSTWARERRGVAGARERVALQLVGWRDCWPS